MRQMVANSTFSVMKAFTTDSIVGDRNTSVQNQRKCIQERWKTFEFSEMLEMEPRPTVLFMQDHIGTKPSPIATCVHFLRNQTAVNRKFSEMYINERKTSFELLETDPKTQCKACLSYWSEGIVYCTCGHLLKEYSGQSKFH